MFGSAGLQTFTSESNKQSGEQDGFKGMCGRQRGPDRTALMRRVAV